MPPPSGRRPVVLVTRDSAYAYRSSVNAVEITTRVRSLPTEVLLGRPEGLPRPCAANADNLVTIPKTWLESRIAALPAPKVAAVEAAIRFALALP